MSSKLQSVNETRDERDRRLGIKCPKDYYHWAELKSSLYVKYMIDNQNRRNYFRDAWASIANLLIPQGERDQIIDQFIFVYENSNIDDIPYPIGGYLSKLFRQISILSQQQKRDAIASDLFAIYNLIRWYGITLLDTGNGGLLTQAQLLALPPNNPYAIFYYIQYGLQNTSIINLIQFVRGKRINYPYIKVKSAQIGITNLEDDELLIDSISHNPNVNPNVNPIYHSPWIHPGQSNCRVSYTGQYGATTKHSRQLNINTGAYGSLQCGVSGSSQFTLFFFLIAVVCGYNFPQHADPNLKFKFIFESALIFLVGDGGHNMHEVLSGLTISIITLNKLLQDLNVFKQFMSTNIFNSPIGIIDHQIETFCIANSAGLDNFRQTIIELYQSTINFNPTLDYRNLNAVNQADEWQYVRDNILLVNYIYNENSPQYANDYNHVINFLTTDNNRYQRNQLENYILIRQLLTPVFIQSAEQRLAQKMLECNLENLTDYTDRSREIVFAFNAFKNPSKKSKRTTRKSSKKSRKTSRKSSKKSRKTSRKSSKKSRKTSRKPSKKSLKTSRK
jgi:hypothetical protein